MPAQNVTADRMLGPQYVNYFDLTLTFQEAIMTFIATILAILLAPVQLWWASAQGDVIIQLNFFFWVKLASCAAMAGVEFATLGTWVHSPEHSTDTSVAAAALASVAAVIITVVVLYTHLHSLQSTALVSLYLTASLLFDATRARSYSARDGMGVFETLSISAAAIKFVLVVLEEIPKRSLVIDEHLRDTLGSEALSGFWNRALFIWLNGVLFTGYRSILTPDDLPNLPPDFSSELLTERFGVVWGKTNKRRRLCLIWACLRTFGFEFFIIFIPRLLLSAFTMLRPMFLQRAVAFVGEHHKSDDVRDGLVGGITILIVGSAVSQAVARHLQNQLAAKLRSVLVMEIFKKSLRLTHDNAKESAAISLMSTDMDGVVNGISRIYDIIAGLAEAGVGVYLLTTFVDDASWIGLGAIIASAVVAIGFGKLIASVRIWWNGKIQERVASTSAALAQIKSLKMMGLGPATAKRIQQLRVEELKAFKTFRYRQMLLTMAIVLMDIMTPVFVIGGALFSPVWNGQLTAPETFGTLLVVALITTPLMAVMNGYSSVSSTAACFSRLQEYLLAEEAIDERISTRIRRPRTTASFTSEKDGSHIHISQTAISGVASEQQVDVAMSGAAIAPTRQSRPLLHNLTMSFRKSTFNVVLGPTGSGKTTFLRALLGESTILAGEVRVEEEHVAYCGQTPWLRNASIRDNITAGRPYDPVWYEVVMNSCLLNADLQRLPMGDLSSAGDNGNNLSGGQKHRVALARALFSHAPIIVLDDVLSALDKTTAESLFSRVFGENGAVSRSSSTVFLATHSVNYMKAADQVVTVDRHGNVTAQHGLDSSNLARKFLEELTQGEVDMRKERGSSESDRFGASLPPEQASIPPVSRGGDISLYSYLFEPVYKPLFFFWMFALFMTAFSEIAAEIFIRGWIEVAPNDTSYYTGFAILGVVSSILSGIQAAMYYLNIIPQAVEHLHKRLTDTVMGSTLHFLTSRKHSTILNRFSQDISLVTVELPLSFFVTIYFASFIILKSIVIATGMKYASPVILVIVGLFYQIARYYLRTSRQVRFHDIEAKAPLFAEFTETATGLEHIRAYGWESRVIARAHKALDTSQKPFYYMLTIQRWLLLSLDLLTLLLSLAVVAAAVYTEGSISQPGFGLSLFLTIQLTSTLTGLIERFAALETALGAVSRIRDFEKTTPQERTPESTEEVEDSWPEAGEIVFENVTARYDPIENTRLALDNVSIRICAGETVGVIGRTGSGKSSMLLTLLNFLEHSGTIKIDDVDISTVPHDVLRSRITTVSQEPVVLDGTVRDNLMPYEGQQNEPTLHDGLIDDVLGQVHLLSHVNARGGVDRPYTEMGFSHGQAQLLSIGRAMLHNMYRETKIILMDEPTSNMDNETDEIIQNLIRDEFIGYTVMVISHRKDTIGDANLFLEFSEGRIVKVTEQRRKRESSMTPSSSAFSSGFSSGFGSRSRFASPS